MPEEEKRYYPHEVANCFPMMKDSEIEEMARDMKQRGQIHTILLFEGKILDGRNRCRACRIAGLVPRVKDITDEIGDTNLADWCMSVNSVRRHMTINERSMVAARLAHTDYVRFIKKQEQVRSGEGVPYPPTWTKVPSTDGGSLIGGGTVKEAARSQNVSVSSVERAARVLADGSEELVAAVEGGEVSLTAGADIAQAPKEEQPAKVNEAKEAKASQPKPTTKGGDEAVLHEVRGHWGHVVRGLHKIGMKEGLSTHLNAISKAIKKKRKGEK